jgi:hypothetical protein
MVVRHPELVEKARKRAEEARRYRERLNSRPEALAKHLERKRISSEKARAKRDPEELRAAARERMRRLRSDPAKRAEQSQKAREWRSDPANSDRYRARRERQLAKKKARRESDANYREQQNAKIREYHRKLRSCDETRKKLNAKSWEYTKRRCEDDPAFKQRLRQRDKAWKLANPDRVKAHRRRQRRKPYYKSSQALRNAVRRALKLGQKRFCSSRYIGIDLSHAKERIESMLRDGWTWENHGKLWHIDHIFPIVKANLDDPVEVLAVSNYRNLRPISVAENKAKKDKVTPEAAALFESLKREIRATCQN